MIPYFSSAMKSLLRGILTNALSLFFLTLIFSGVEVTGGLTTYILGGFVLSVMFNILKPIINILSLPLNIMTMGTFSFVINVAIFYVATQIIGNITIKAFVFPGFSFAGFIVPELHLNTFFAYVAAALVQSVIVTFISWLRK